MSRKTQSRALFGEVAQRGVSGERKLQARPHSEAESQQSSAENVAPVGDRAFPSMSEILAGCILIHAS